MSVRAIKEKELVNVTFWIPETTFDNMVCRAYLAEKYPDAPYISSQINLASIAGWPTEDKIVIVRRDTWPKAPGRATTREKDEEGKWMYVDVPPETYLHEVVEMAPIHIHSAMVATAANRFNKSKLDLKPLIARLCEVMPQPYRIDLPRHDKDTEARFVHA
jgi:hypothetical protein